MQFATRARCPIFGVHLLAKDMQAQRGQFGPFRSDQVGDVKQVFVHFSVHRRRIQDRALAGTACDRQGAKNCAAIDFELGQRDHSGANTRGFTIDEPGRQCCIRARRDDNDIAPARIDENASRTGGDVTMHFVDQIDAKSSRERPCMLGGGIVADSVPVNEYRETLHKAAGMLRAVSASIAERAG